MKVICKADTYEQLYITDLKEGDIFRTYDCIESLYTYMKICPVVDGSTILNAVRLNNGTIWEIDNETQVVPYEGELDIKRKY